MNAGTSKHDPARFKRTLSSRCLQNAISSLHKVGSLFHTVEVACDRSGSRLPLTPGVRRGASRECNRRDSGTSGWLI